MVEELHRQRVLKFLDAFYSGDLDGALAYYTDDIDFVAQADFYTLRDGRIMRISQFLDTFDAVQQLLDRDIAGDLAGGRLGKR
jgi:ketosteroid isomerase-like protein